MNNLLLFGGTFDPIHYGHLHTAINVQKHFHFNKVAFLPCQIPVIEKSTLTTASQHRLAMLKLALAEQPKHYHFDVDLHEINRNSPSYTVTTLKAFRQELGKEISITLLLGLDAFYQLPQWYHWQEIIKLANLLVIDRVGYTNETLSKEIQTLLLRHQTTDQQALLKSSHGIIVRFDAGNYPISSTAVRQDLMAKQLSSHVLPKTVAHYIIEHKLYQPIFSPKK